MTTGTVKRTVTFKRPFNLSGFDGEQPAGTYSVETDDELLEGSSVPAYGRMATMMQIEPGFVDQGDAVRVAVIDPRQLEAALAADAAHGTGAGLSGWRAPNALGLTSRKR